MDIFIRMILYKLIYWLSLDSISQKQSFLNCGKHHMQPYGSVSRRVFEAKNVLPIRLTFNMLFFIIVLAPEGRLMNLLCASSSAG